MKQERDNQRWLNDLQSEGVTLDVALTDLREALSRHLQTAFATRPDFMASMLDDILQESLLRVLKGLRQFQDRSRFITWATAIAIRVGLTELRQRRWRDVSLDALVSEANREPVAISGQDTATEHQDLVNAMYDVIRSELTERQRTVLLAEIKGMAQEEISRQLGCSRNALYKLSHDARRRLKEGLLLRGFDKQSFRSESFHGDDSSCH